MCIRDSFVGDHEPITPISSATPDSKKFYTKLHWNAYEIIVRHYLALFYDNAEIEKGTLRVTIKNEPFIISGQRVVKLGYLEVYPYDIPKSSLLPPELPDYVVKGMSLKKDKTKPPPRYTESDLISLMEKLNLGTKSTRPEMIEINKRRKYIVRKGQTLRITPIGRALMEILERIWPEFVNPSFTAKIEEKLKLIMEQKIIMKFSKANIKLTSPRLARLGREKSSNYLFQNLCKNPIWRKSNKFCLNIQEKIKLNSIYE